MFTEAVSTTHLGEVSQDVAALGVALCHDVEEKRLYVEVERLVVEKELGHKAETLAVDLVQFPVHLEGGDKTLAVDLVARGVSPRADGLEWGQGVNSVGNVKINQYLVSFPGPPCAVPRLPLHRRKKGGGSHIKLIM